MGNSENNRKKLLFQNSVSVSPNRSHTFEKCHLTGKTLWKWVNGLNIYDSEKKDPRGRSAPIRGGGGGGNIHVYINMIFKVLFL